MKKQISIIFLIASFVAYAQNETTETIAKPAITEIGKPVGNRADMKIGKEGGSLSSSDGKIDLVIPPGALSKKTNISIQPITNLVPNGTGNAYRLEPSGIVFQQPVQLIFHYTEKEAESSLPDLMGIAMQGNNNQWYRLKDFSLDTIAKTISGNINHFSDWTKFDKLKLFPGYARVKVNKSKALEIMGVDDDLLAPLGDDDLLAPLVKQKLPWEAIWTANGILNGNKTVGEIITQNLTIINYKAPSDVPVQNPVAVRVQLKGVSYKYNRKTFTNLKLVSYVLVFDTSYEVSINYHGGNLGSGAPGLLMSEDDSASFIITVNGLKSDVIEIKNYPEAVTYTTSGPCTAEFINKAKCSGLVHISQLHSIVIYPIQPPEQKFKRVLVRFYPVIAVLPIFRITCPKQPAVTWDKNSDIAALPESVFFLDNEEEQIIKESGYMIKITPVKEE